MYTREEFEKMRLNSAAEMSKDNELQKSAGLKLADAPFNSPRVETSEKGLTLRRYPSEHLVNSIIYEIHRR